MKVLSNGLAERERRREDTNGKMKGEGGDAAFPAWPGEVALLVDVVKAEMV